MGGPSVKGDFLMSNRRVVLLPLTFIQGGQRENAQFRHLQFWDWHLDWDSSLCIFCLLLHFVTVLLLATVSEGLDATQGSHVCKLRGSRMSVLIRENSFAVFSKVGKTWTGFWSPEAL